MADERIIIRLDIDGLEQNIQQIGELEREMKLLAEEKKKISKETKNLSAATTQETKRYAELDEKIKVLRRDKAALSKDVKKLDQSQKANTRTIDGLTKRNAQLTAEMRKLDLTTKAGQARLKLLRSEFSQNDAKVRQFNESLNRHQHNVGNYRGALDGARNGLAAMAAGITAAVMAFQRINQMMQESIELFKTQELAERQLQFAAGDASQALIEQAAALQKQTTFGDEATIQMQALLSSFGSTAEQVQTLTPLILDYAAASGKDLSQAATQLNNILNGTSTTLRGTSIQLSEGASATQRYNAVLQELSKHQGAAAALADTQAGRLAQLTNEYNDQREELGAKLIPIQLAFMEGTMSTIEAVSKLVEFLNENKRAIAALAVTATAYAAIQARTAIAETAMLAITKLKTAWTNRATIAQAALNFVMSMNPIGLVVAALGGLVTWLATSEKGMQVFRDAFEKVNQGVEWLKLNILNLLKLAFYPYIKGLELVTNGLNKLGLVSDDMAGKITNLTAINFKQVESTKAAGAGWDNLTAAIERTKEVEEQLAKDREDRARKQNAQAARDEELRKRELQAIDERRNAQKKASDEQAKAMEGPAAKAYELAKGADALTQAENELAESLKSIDQLLDEVDLSFEEEGTGEPPIVSQADLAAQKLEKVSMALESLKGISLNSAITQLSQMTDETTKFERAMVLVGASVTALNDILATRFANQKAQIEQQTLAEKEAIEATTLSEEEKRIRIERAEQKKATAIEKIEQKQAKQEKANAIIQSLINTALGITNALATLGPFAFTVIPAIAAIGAVQTGIIAAQQFADGGQVADLGSGEGGAIPIGAQNIPALGNGDNVLATVRTGEVILNESQQARLKALTGSSNVFRSIGVPGFADGGLVPSFSNTQRSTASRIEQSNAQAIGAMQSIKVVNVATETAGMATMVSNIETEATFG